MDEFEYRGDKKEPKKKFDFKQKKDCAIKSIAEVNCFLLNLKGKLKFYYLFYIPILFFC